jgi:hypothetical protein
LCCVVLCCVVSCVVLCCVVLCCVVLWCVVWCLVLYVSSSCAVFLSCLMLSVVCFVVCPPRVLLHQNETCLIASMYLCHDMARDLGLFLSDGSDRFLPLLWIHPIRSFCRCMCLLPLLPSAKQDIVDKIFAFLKVWFWVLGFGFLVLGLRFAVCCLRFAVVSWQSS